MKRGDGISRGWITHPIKSRGNAQILWTSIVQYFPTLSNWNPSFNDTKLRAWSSHLRFKYAIHILVRTRDDSDRDEDGFGQGRLCQFITEKWRRNNRDIQKRASERGICRARFQAVACVYQLCRQLSRQKAGRCEYQIIVRRAILSNVSLCHGF